MSIILAAKLISAAGIMALWAWETHCERNDRTLWVMMTTDMQKYPFYAPGFWSRSKACELAERKFKRMLDKTGQIVATVYVPSDQDVV